MPISKAPFLLYYLSIFIISLGSFPAVQNEIVSICLVVFQYMKIVFACERWTFSYEFLQENYSLLKKKAKPWENEIHFQVSHKRKDTLGQNKLFIQKLPRIWCLKNANFVKNESLKLWILWKMRFWKCAFCEKWGFENMNFVKNENLKMWILWTREFENVIFVKNVTLKMWILSNMIFSKCEFSDKLRIFAPVWITRLKYKNRIE